MSPYTSLLVLALAAFSIVTPVLSADPAQPLGENEGGSQGLWSRLTPKHKAELAFLGILGAGFTGLAVWGSIESHKNHAREVSRRKERSFGRGMPVDISDRSFLDRRTSSHLELLNRADLGEALSVFGRMLDELD